MNISEDQRHALVDASLRFLATIGQIYGSDRAMEFWDALGNVIHPDLKGHVFSAMLNGNAGGDIVIRKLPTHPNAIGLIKAIRTWDKKKLGLKEAKDMYDALKDLGRPIRVEVYYEQAGEARREFATLGCI